MAISENFCCCLDVATGSLLAGICTCFLSLAFTAIGIDSLVEANRNSLNKQDTVIMNSVYGCMIAISVLYAISSISLVLGASKKSKMYVAPWLLLTPLWCLVAVCTLLALPETLKSAVVLSGFSSRVSGSVVVLVLCIFSLVCVCIFFVTLVKDPLQKLRSSGVVETLETGFSNGYSRLRESIRPSKSKIPVTFNNKPASSSARGAAVTIPDITLSVVLDPNHLKTTRQGPPSHVIGSSDTRYSRYENESEDVGESWEQSLSKSEQFGNQPGSDGLSNPAYYSEH